MTIRLGLAGTGRIGASHAETLKALPGVASVVVADPDRERARTTATKLGVEYAPDI
ncbi:Gfo/Idh/MocA family oxidoreductase, partial [Nocardia gipuzkoensis]